MIVERLNFQAKYGRGDELVALFHEFANTLQAKFGIPGKMARIYTDHTGAMFTVQAEIEYTDLAEYVRANEGEAAQYGSPDFQAWFGKMMDCTERGEKQLMNLEVL